MTKNDIRRLKIKKFLEGPAPTLILVAVAEVALVAVYAKYTSTRNDIYAGFLNAKAELFAEALDKTTASIVTALHPE